MAGQAGAGLQPGTPDLQPDRVQGDAATASLDALLAVLEFEAPACPRCGAALSRFPRIDYCGYCEYVRPVAA